MALTYTPLGDLESPCPDFSLPSVDGNKYQRDDFHRARALVVMFICNHCPYVRAIEERLLKLAHSYDSTDVAFVAICANDPSENAEDQPSALLQRWREKNYGFPYLIDSTQEVAKAFGAVCTPDLYVFGARRKLYYRGRLDDSWRNGAAVKKEDLRLAIEGARLGLPPPTNQNPAMGCSIKWKKK